MVRLFHDVDIHALAHLPNVVAQMEGGYRADARGEVVLFPRNRYDSERVSLAWLGAAIPTEGVLGFRSYLYGPDGGDRGHQLVVLYGYPDMVLRAIFVGRMLGNLRTGATLAAALRLIEPNVREVGFVGTGTQAKSALACIVATSHPSRIIAWSPNPEHREQFQNWSEHALHVEVELRSNVADLVRESPTIVLATAAERTVISAEMVSEPRLFLSISAYRRPELDPSILDAAPRVWTDSVVQASGPGTLFDSEVRRQKLAPLGQGIADESARDSSSHRIVVNTGAAWEEVLLGKYLLKRAESNNVGIVFEIPESARGLDAF